MPTPVVVGLYALAWKRQNFSIVTRRRLARARSMVTRERFPHR
jgi:hypothetical protein